MAAVAIFIPVNVDAVEMELQHELDDFALQLFGGLFTIGTSAVAKQAQRVYRLPVHGEIVVGGVGGGEVEGGSTKRLW